MSSRLYKVGFWGRDRSRPHLPYPSWEEYVYALMDGFGYEYADPMAEIKLIERTRLVEDN